MTLSQPTILLITGIPASGKSTVGQLLAQHFPKAVHIDGDVINGFIVTGKVYMSSDPKPEALKQLYLRYRQAAMLAQSYLEAGFTVVWQDNCFGSTLYYCLDLIAQHPHRVVVLTPSVAVVKERNATRGKDGYAGYSIEELDQSLRFETPKIGIWIDSSEQTPEQTVNEILERTNLELDD
jgi:tRNA uridine 5-carbamoylmethylation protein Kti12